MKKYIFTLSLCLNIGLLILSGPALIDLTLEVLYRENFRAQREAMKIFERDVATRYPDFASQYWFESSARNVYTGARYSHDWCTALIEIGERLDLEKYKRGVSNVSDQ